MKRTLSAALAVLLIASCSAQTRLYQTLGFPISPVAVGTQQLSTGATFVDVMFTPLTTKTVNDIAVYFSAVAGSVGSSDLTVTVYADLNGRANTGSSLATTSTLAAPAATGYNDFTGLSLVLTAYTAYHFVLSNGNGTPATNNVTVRYMSGASPSAMVGAFNGTTFLISTNSGSTWSTVGVGQIPLTRIGFSDSTYAGFPYIALVAPASISSTERIYSTHEFGASFTPSGSGTVNVRCASFYMLTAGGPTANVQSKIYSDNGTTATLLATSAQSYPASSMDASTNRWVPFCFSSTVPLDGGTKYRVVLSEQTNADASSKYFAPSVVSVDSTASSLTLTPFNGTLRGGVCNGTCTTSANWTDTYDLPLFVVALDAAAMTTGGGGGTRGYAY